MKENSLLSIAFAGGLSGAIADINLHTMDTVKTRMQGQLTSGAIRYHGIIQTFVLIIKEEGISALFGGLTAATAGSLLSTTVYFGSYELLKRQFKQMNMSDSSRYFVAAAFGDLCASVFYVPSEVIKTRLQLHSSKNSPYQYRGSVHAFKSIYQQKGVAGFYKGLGATLLRDVPFTAIQFTIYENIQHYLRSKQSTNHILRDLTAGAIAGGCAGFLTNPLDVVKTCLQTQKKNFNRFMQLDASNAKVVYYDGIWAAMGSIYRRQGIRGLFSGAVPRMVWTSSQSMVMFLVYENLVLALSQL